MYKKPPTTTQPSSTTRNTLTTTTATTSTSTITSSSRLSSTLGSQSSLGGRGTSPTPPSQSSVYYRLYLEDTNKSNQTGTQTTSSLGARPSSPTPSTSTKTYTSSLSITLGSNSKASTTSTTSSSTSTPSTSGSGARQKTYRVSNINNSDYDPDFLKFIGDFDDDINSSSENSTTSTSSSPSTSGADLGARSKTSSSLSALGSDSIASSSLTKSSNVEGEASSKKQPANFGNLIGSLVGDSLFEELSGRINKQLSSTEEILNKLKKNVHDLSEKTFNYELRSSINDKFLTEEGKKSINYAANTFGEQIVNMAENAFKTGIKNFEESSKPRNFDPFDPRIAAVTISNGFGEDVKASSNQQLQSSLYTYHRIFR